MKKTETLLTQFSVMIYINIEFNFYEENKTFFSLVLGNYFHY